MSGSKKKQERAPPSNEEVEKFFNAYKSPNADEMGPDEITRFCDDMGIDSGDVDILT